MTENLLEQIPVYEHVAAALLGMTRLTVLAIVAPFLGGAVITGQLRFGLVFALYLVLHPRLLADIPAVLNTEGLARAALVGTIMVKEALLGFFLGWLGSLLFWAVQSAGFFMDNQRGDTQSTAPDPWSGEQTSPLGSLLFQGTVYLFYMGGGFLAYLGLVYTSYVAWPVTSLLPSAAFLSPELPLLFASQVGWLVSLMLLLAAPAAVACLLIDISLGLINRFASQLNVYILAMPLKSLAVSLLMVLYFSLFMSTAQGMFPQTKTWLHTLQKMLAP